MPRPLTARSSALKLGTPGSTTRSCRRVSESPSTPSLLRSISPLRPGRMMSTRRGKRCESPKLGFGVFFDKENSDSQQDAFLYSQNTLSSDKFTNASVEYCDLQYVGGVRSSSPCSFKHELEFTGTPGASQVKSPMSSQSKSKLECAKSASNSYEIQLEREIEHYEAALQMLRPSLGNYGGARDEYLKTLLDFVQCHALHYQRGGMIYLCGASGIGKTCVAEHTLKSALKMPKVQSRCNTSIINFSCANREKDIQVLVEILSRMMKTTKLDVHMEKELKSSMELKGIHGAVNTFTALSKRASKKLWLCLIDELDYLPTRGKIRADVRPTGSQNSPKFRDALLALALAATHRESRIIVIGISNTIQLSQHLVGMSIQTLTFSPYTEKEIIGIITQKLKAAQEHVSKSKIELFSPAAILLFARKSANCNGDIRMALNGLCRAIEDKLSELSEKKSAIVTRNAAISQCEAELFISKKRSTRSDSPLPLAVSPKIPKTTRPKPPKLTDVEDATLPTDSLPTSLSVTQSIAGSCDSFSQNPESPNTLESLDTPRASICQVESFGLQPPITNFANLISQDAEGNTVGEYPRRRRHSSYHNEEEEEQAACFDKAVTEVNENTYCVVSTESVSESLLLWNTQIVDSRNASQQTPKRICRAQSFGVYSPQRDRLSTVSRPISQILNRRSSVQDIGIKKALSYASTVHSQDASVSKTHEKEKDCAFDYDSNMSQNQSIGVGMMNQRANAVYGNDQQHVVNRIQGLPLMHQIYLLAACRTAQEKLHKQSINDNTTTTTTTNNNTHVAMEPIGISFDDVEAQYKLLSNEIPNGYLLGLQLSTSCWKHAVESFEQMGLMIGTNNSGTFKGASQRSPMTTRRNRAFSCTPFRSQGSNSSVISSGRKSAFMNNLYTCSRKVQTWELQLSPALIEAAIKRLQPMLMNSDLQGHFSRGMEG